MRSRVKDTFIHESCLLSAGGHCQQIHQQLCELLARTRISEMLDRVGRAQDEESCTDLYRRYLQDYIRSVHQVTHKHSSVEYMVSCVCRWPGVPLVLFFTADRGGSEQHNQ